MSKRIQGWKNGTIVLRIFIPNRKRGSADLSGLLSNAENKALSIEYEEAFYSFGQEEKGPLFLRAKGR
jgi:hypothetical protein